MDKLQAMLKMRMELVALYPEDEDMLRVAEDAGLPFTNIKLREKPVNSWRNILAEADKQRRIPELVEVVGLEYPLSDDFRLALEAYCHLVESSREALMPRPSGERRQVTSQIDSQIEASVDIRMPHILTGVIQLWERETYPLLVWRVSSLTGEKRRVLLVSYIEGYTAKAIDTVELEGKDVQTVRQLPTFFPERLQGLTFPVRATLNLRVENLQGDAELHRTEAVWLHPRSSVPLAVRDPQTGEWQVLTRWLAAYVTPTEPKLMSFLRTVARYHPDGRLVGYQVSREEVDSQVKAIFEALKGDADIVYTLSILDFFPDSTMSTQRVRLPRESLEEHQAGDLDATLLFASLLEAISLNPALVLVPGHALVGWERWRDSGEWDYLEATMIATYTFEEAVASARRTVEHYRAQNRLRRLPLNELRAQGILPLA